MAEPQKLNELQGPPDSQIVISVHRKLTFVKGGGDYDGPAGGITFPLSATPDQIDRALARFNEVVTELDMRLTKEKQESLKRAGATAPPMRPPASVRTAAPAPAGDPYSGLEWREGRTKTGKPYGYRMVKPDQPALATQLHNALKAASGNRLTFGSIEYRLTVAKVDRLPAYKAGTEFLQRWAS
jgi:hypothetical protein